MDYKDFKKYLQDQVKRTLSNSLSSYSAKLRNSRPRAKDNIINPKQKGIWLVKKWFVWLELKRQSVEYCCRL